MAENSSGINVVPELKLMITAKVYYGSVRMMDGWTNFQYTEILEN